MIKVQSLDSKLNLAFIMVYQSTQHNTNAIKKRFQSPKFVLIKIYSARIQKCLFLETLQDICYN
jgi:hypothetical protein